MRILLRQTPKVTMGAKRIKRKFLLWPRIFRQSKKTNQLELRWLCYAEWQEEMCEWLSSPPDGPSRGGYSPKDMEPDTYGWRGQHWIN